jgi:tRNA pseudouridine55 synthase
LGGCAHLAALRRTGSGRFRVEQAVSLEALSPIPASLRAQHLLPLAALLGSLPRAELDPEQEARFRNGRPLKSSIGQGICAVYGAHGGVIGLGEADGAGTLRPLRLVAETQAADKHPKTL